MRDMPARLVDQYGTECTEVAQESDRSNVRDGGNVVGRETVRASVAPVTQADVAKPLVFLRPGRP